MNRYRNCIEILPMDNFGTILSEGCCKNQIPTISSSCCWEKNETLECFSICNDSLYSFFQIYSSSYPLILAIELQKSVQSEFTLH